jgi:hypothetical protein
MKKKDILALENCYMKLFDDHAEDAEDIQPQQPQQQPTAAPAQPVQSAIPTEEEEATNKLTGAEKEALDEMVEGDDHNSFSNQISRFLDHHIPTDSDTGARQMKVTLVLNYIKSILTSTL